MNWGQRANLPAEGEAWAGVLMKAEIWFRDLDSNQDTQLQRLMSYRLDDPGTADNSLAEGKECTKGK